MNKISVFFLFLVLLNSCTNKQEKIKPKVQPISESVYASGTIKSENQYEAFANVNGIINNIFLSDGDSVHVGTPVLTISNELQQLNEENAKLSAQFSDLDENKSKLDEALSLISISKDKMKLDSLLYFRQALLWKQQIGTKVDLEQREFAYQNSKNAFYNANLSYRDLNRQLNYTSAQSKKNLLIAEKLKSDYVVKSEIDGIVYSIIKKRGEIVGLQTPLAIIGDAKNFILEMQVDENDILKIRSGQKVLITLDSYKGKLFEAVVTKIDPLMNDRNKTFIVEARFIKSPEVLYPNISFEANILIQSKAQAMVIPRRYVLNDSIVVKIDKQQAIIKTGLKDYDNIEVISGITSKDQLILPLK